MILTLQCGISLEHVEHHVADFMDVSGNAFPRKVGNRFARRAEQQITHVVRDDPIDLLRHRSVVAAETCFDMSHSDAQLRRAQRCRECGVRVAVREKHVRLLIKNDRLQPRQNCGRLFTVRSRPDRELIRGGSHA